MYIVLHAYRNKFLAHSETTKMHKREKENDGEREKTMGGGSQSRESQTLCKSHRQRIHFLPNAQIHSAGKNQGFRVELQIFTLLWRERGVMP